MRSQDPSESRADLIFEHLSGGVIAVDRFWTINYLNAAAARTLAAQPETALGKPLGLSLVALQDWCRLPF